MCVPRRFANLFIISMMGLLISCGQAPVTELTIEPGFIRTPSANAPATAAYFTVTSPIDDNLVGARIEGEGTIEIHTMTMDDGVMRMRRIDHVALPAGEAVSLAPGGMHLMIMSPSPAMADMDHATVTLEFEQAGAVDATLPITRTSPGHDHH